MQTKQRGLLDEMAERRLDNLLDRLDLAGRAPRPSQRDRGRPVGKRGHDQVGKGRAELDELGDGGGDGGDDVWSCGGVQGGDELLEELVGFVLERGRFEDRMVGTDEGEVGLGGGLALGE